jgi:hypothetical protein
VHLRTIAALTGDERLPQGVLDQLVQRPAGPGRMDLRLDDQRDVQLQSRAHAESADTSAHQATRKVV